MFSRTQIQDLFAHDFPFIERPRRKPFMSNANVHGNRKSIRVYKARLVDSTDFLMDPRTRELNVHILLQILELECARENFNNDIFSNYTVSCLATNQGICVRLAERMGNSTPKCNVLNSLTFEHYNTLASCALYHYVYGVCDCFGVNFCTAVFMSCDYKSISTIKRLKKIHIYVYDITIELY